MRRYCFGILGDWVRFDDARKNLDYLTNLITASDGKHLEQQSQNEQFWTEIKALNDKIEKMQWHSEADKRRVDLLCVMINECRVECSKINKVYSFLLALCIVAGFGLVFFGLLRIYG